MYERAGYSAIERYNDNPYAQAWFEKAAHRERRASAYCSRVRKASWAGFVDELHDRPELEAEPAHQRDRLGVARVRLGHEPLHGRVGERDARARARRPAAGEAACTVAGLGAA